MVIIFAQYAITFTKRSSTLKNADARWISTAYQTTGNVPNAAQKKKISNLALA